MLNLIVLDRLLHLALIFELFRLCLLLAISDHLEGIVDSIELILKHDHTFKIDLNIRLAKLVIQNIKILIHISNCSTIHATLIAEIKKLGEYLLTEIGLF